MRPIISTTIKLGAISLFLLFQAYESKQTGKEATEPKIDSSKTTDMKKKMSEPINLSQFRIATNSFGLRYYTENVLNKESIVIPFEPVINSLFQLYPNTNDTGLVFHYGLSEDLKNLVYMISPGNQNPTNDFISWTAFPERTNNQNIPHYILLSGAGENGAITYLDEAAFCKYQNRYRENIMMISDTSDTSDTSDSSIKKISDHPYMVYHQGKQLNLFHTQRQKNPSHLYLFHGLGNRDQGQPPFHIPLLLWGDDKTAFEIDDDRSENGKYVNKAFDLGHPCPTYCKPPRDTKTNCQ